MKLKRIGESFYLKKYASGEALVNKMQNLDFSKYEISDSSKQYLMGIISRKVSNELKGEIIRLTEQGIIRLIVCDNKSEGFPDFLFVAPSIVAGKPYFFLNIGKYAKFDKNTKEVNDIDPRILYALLVNAYTQYKLYMNPSKVLDIKFQEVIIQSYKKIFNRIVSKIVNVNTLTNEEKLTYDCLLVVYILKVLLLLDSPKALLLAETTLSKVYKDNNKVNTQLKMINADKINDFESFLDQVKVYCPSFIKLNPVLLLKEFAITMKQSAVLAIDLIQIYTSTLMSISVGSANIFNDKLIESILDAKELDHLRIVVSRF